MTASSPASPRVHPTAVIDPAAKVPASCHVGPYCVIGAEVELGEDNELVFREWLGLSAERFAQLRSNGVI